MRLASRRCEDGQKEEVGRGDEQKRMKDREREGMTNRAMEPIREEGGEKGKEGKEQGVGVGG